MISNTLPRNLAQIQHGQRINPYDLDPPTFILGGRLLLFVQEKYLNKQQNRLAQNVQTFSVPRQYILVTMMVDDDGDNKLMVSLD